MVVLTRSKSGAARKMTNEKDLEGKLSALGWDILTFADFTLLERVEVGEKLAGLWRDEVKSPLKSVCMSQRTQ